LTARPEIAALVSLLRREYVDSILNMVIVALNAVVDVIQEPNAELALAAVEKMATPNAPVIRDGHHASIPSRPRARAGARERRSGHH